ncbi:hypothetical protein [Desulfobacter sp.]|uniref:hypothetical protein n=1 Tax=Desulfobacter sp. TaxID=2294 RepID=UPI003D147F13
MVAENKIIPVAKKIMGITDRRSSFDGGYRSNVPGRKKDRRKASYDRRKSVRDGVIVTLSFKKDRRKSPDRRFQASGRPVPTNDSRGSIYDIIA